MSTPSALDNMELVAEKALSEAHFCLPARVVRVRTGKDARQFVDVRLAMQREVVQGDDNEEADEEYDVLYSRPVAYAQGGGFSVNMPLQPDDPVMVLFAERSIDAWIELSRRGGKPVAPGDTSLSPLQGGIVLPIGPAARSELADVGAHDSSDFTIGRRDGTVMLRLTQDGQLASLMEGEDWIALAAKVDAEIARLDARIDSEVNALKQATVTGLTAVGAALAANGATAATTFQGASATIPAPTNPQSVAASKSKAT